MIPNDFIQTLLGRVDIVDVIDRVVPLKKAGANFVACCPFHSEKTPSFTVSPGKQFYHCFGCGAHGTAIGFVIEYAGKSFVDAVHDLAQHAGLTVPQTARDERPESEGRAQDLAGTLLAAARFYRAELKGAPHAIDYLRRRGLTGQIAARFGIGYAPAGWQPLAAGMPDYGDKNLDAAGLVIAGDGKRYDRFRDRIMFPIHDMSGQVIGFGGRVLGDGEPKYLNSPETAVFSKGRELYGWYQARQAIRAAGQVTVVEGYMDVVALAQHGVENVVATLGTSTTSAHAQKLFRMTDTVVFCFDGDAAGKRAAWRALENTLPVLIDGKHAKFLFLPDDEDPDDVVRREGKEAFEARVGEALPLSEFLLCELVAMYPPVSPEGRAALVNAAKPLLLAMRAPILSTLLRRRLASIAGLSDAEMATLVPHSPPSSGNARIPSRPARATPSLVRDVLRWALLRPDAVKALSVPLVASADPAAAALEAVVLFCQQANLPLHTAGVMQQFSGSPHEATLVSALQLADTEALDSASIELQLTEGVKKLRLNLGVNAGEDIPQLTELTQGTDLSPEEAERLRQLGAARLQSSLPARQ